MLIPLFKNVVIFYMCFYSYIKICKTTEYFQTHFLLLTFFSFLISMETCIFKSFVPEVSYFAPAITLFVCVCICEKNISPINSCISLTSYILNLLIYQLIALIVAFIFVLAFDNSELTDAGLPILIASILHPFVIIGIFKLKRFAGRISLLSFNSLINGNTLLGIIVLTIFTLEQFASLGISTIRYIRVSSYAICLCILIFWWRTQITKTYREKLRLLEMKTLRAAKVENEAYISRLEAENKRLGTIIHKDNRIVNAMADSVCDYLSTASGSDLETLHSKGLSLSDEINSIKTYRQELLCEDPFVENSIPQTNLAGVDAIIAFMLKEASTHGITLQFHFDKEVFSSKHFTASEMDLVHLLSDLLQNAIIATRHAGSKSIELSFQSLKGTPAISVSDSGIPFEIDTYMKLGMCQASTHLEEGGTGIGLIDIWSFKKKYHASLVIEELDDSIYTKRLSLLFDAKNKYLIVSNRYQQIISSQTRSDLLVIVPVTNELVELIGE